MGACQPTAAIDLPIECKESERTGNATRLARIAVKEAIKQYGFIAPLIVEARFPEYIRVPDRLIWNTTIGARCVDYTLDGVKASRGIFADRDLTAQLRSSPSISQFHAGSDERRCIWETRITSKNKSGVTCSLAHRTSLRFGPVNGISLDEDGEFGIVGWTNHVPTSFPPTTVLPTISSDINIVPFHPVIGFRFSADLVSGTVRVIAIRHDEKMMLLFTLSIGATRDLKESHPVSNMFAQRPRGRNSSD